MHRLEEIGWPSITPAQDGRRGATVAVPSRDSAGLAAELMKQEHRDLVPRRQCCAPAFIFNNNDDDVETFVAAMQELRDSYAPRTRNTQTGS